MYDIKALYEAESVQHACALLLAHPEAKVLAGGSDVLIQIREGKLAGATLVSIYGLDELRGVAMEADGTIRIGALTSFSHITRSPVIEEHIAVLGEAVDMVGGPQIRNIGTIGGNTCNGVTSADSGSTLVAYDAVVELTGALGVRRVPIRDFYIKAGKVDLRPGEIVVADGKGLRSIETHCGKVPKSLCVFEFIYFARPDSVIDGSSVHVARQRAGAFLALEHPVQADVVIGVPDSGLDAALGYARQSGIPYGMGFIKNKYIGRTFISPTQALRESEVSIKLNPIRSVVAGKRVVLIDDSIVRGTTCRRTIDLLRKAGAREIHMRVSAPPFVSECYYGTDIDDKDKLIATHHSVEEIAKIIGVDSLGYLSLENVVKLADSTSGFCTACFGGGYPTALPEPGGKDRFECPISEREEA